MTAKTRSRSAVTGAWTVQPGDRLTAGSGAASAPAPARTPVPADPAWSREGAVAVSPVMVLSFVGAPRCGRRAVASGRDPVVIGGYPIPSSGSMVAWLTWLAMDGEGWGRWVW